MSRQQIERRIDEINSRIAHATVWGAMLTALNEERNHLEAELRHLDNGPEPAVVSD